MVTAHLYRIKPLGRDRGEENSLKLEEETPEEQRLKSVSECLIRKVTKQLDSGLDEPELDIPDLHHLRWLLGDCRLEAFSFRPRHLFSKQVQKVETVLSSNVKLTRDEVLLSASLCHVIIPVLERVALKIPFIP